METTLGASLPLARPSGGDRAGPRHRHEIPLPAPAGANPRRYAMAAAAALVYRYAGEASVAIGGLDAAGHPETTGLELADRTTVGELLATVAAAGPAAGPATAAGLPRHVTVLTLGQPEAGPRTALTIVAGPGAVELLMARSEFGAAAAAQYARHLTRLLTALAGDPGAVLRDIQLLGPAEIEQVTVGWNQTDAPVPPEYFHEVVARFARATPDVVAVRWPGGELTYAGLDGQANQLARRLRALGVRRGDRVGVCFKRGPDSLVAQLACFKLAAAAILLDPEFPGERIRYMIEDAAAAVVVTLTAHLPAVSGSAPAVLPLDACDWRSEPAAEVSERVDADDLIHICYTSGSTGAPKAVMVRHGAARNLIYSMRVLAGMTSQSHGTWLAAPGYGMVEVECFPVLAAGATVHIPEHSVVTSPEWLRDWLVAEGITHALLMKAMAERLFALPWPAGTALRNVRICGERVQAWPPATLPFHVSNLYGSAEATVVATCDLTELAAELGEEGQARRLPPIGRPLHNVRVYVLGDDLRPVPPGVVGEIHVAGQSLSAGYLNQPDATAAKWIPNPVDPARDPVLYRTGDLARYWTDGSIEIVGRTDNQVKIRGNRVHLGEIEVVLAAQPGVRQAVIAPRRDGYGDIQLVAYVEPASAPGPAPQDIRQALRERLPAFMVPAAYVIGRLPTTPNGKIDRAHLPEPPRSRPDSATPYTEPRDDLERALSEMWAGLLELDRVGVADDFFDLGGDSLRAARLTGQVNDAFGIDVDLGDLFHEPTIERMAAIITAAPRAAAPSARA